MGFPHEVSQLRKQLGEGYTIVVPGFRPQGSSKDDQERIGTLSQTIWAGASHLVVGRPITQARDPARVAEAIVREIEQATSADSLSLTQD